jgi:hypothetical protein
LYCELREGFLVNAAAALQVFARAPAQPLERPACARHSDDGDIQVAAADELLQRGEYLPVGEVSGRADEDESIRAAQLHRIWMRDRGRRSPHPARASIDENEPASLTRNHQPGAACSRTSLRSPTVAAQLGKARRRDGILCRNPAVRFDRPVEARFGHSIRSCHRA